MKKNILWSILLLVIFLGCNKKEKTNTLSKLNLKGKVFSIVNYGCHEDYGFTDNKGDCNSIIDTLVFDELGNVILYKGWGRDTIYNYDLQGKFVNNSWKYMLLEKGHKNLFEVKYNKKNLLVSKFELTKTNRDALESYIYKYNGNGDLISKLKLKEEYDSNEGSLYNYDNKGTLTSELNLLIRSKDTLDWHKSKDTLNWYKYQYNENEDLASSEITHFLYFEGKLIDTITIHKKYTYDKFGNVILVTGLHSQYGPIQEEYKYDEKNNLIKEAKYNNYTVKSRNETDFVYSYDDFGNWIRKDTYYNYISDDFNDPKTLTQIEKRKIQYYKDESEYLDLYQDFFYPPVGEDNCKSVVINHCTNLDRNANRNYITQFCEYKGNGVYLVQLYDVDSQRDFAFHVKVDENCNVITVIGL